MEDWSVKEEGLVKLEPEGDPYIPTYDTWRPSATHPRESNRAVGSDICGEIEEDCELEAASKENSRSFSRDPPGLWLVDGDVTNPELRTGSPTVGSQSVTGPWGENILAVNTSCNFDAERLQTGVEGRDETKPLLSDLGCAERNRETKQSARIRDSQKRREPGLSTTLSKTDTSCKSRMVQKKTEKKVQMKDLLRENDPVKGEKKPASKSKAREETDSGGRSNDGGVCHQSSHGNAFVVHMKSDEDQNPFTCPTCGLEISRRVALTEHAASCSKKPFSCETCGERFASNSQLGAHQREHAEEWQYLSQAPGSDYSDSCNLSEAKPHTCEVCSVTFPCSMSLFEHQMRHSVKQPFVCHICNARFSLKFYLTTHIRTHTGERPYLCDTCGEKFTQKSSLNTHEKLHTNDKPFECGICKAKFALKAYLTAHHRTHSGERPYKCELCGSEFTQRSALTTHSKLHSLKKDFACQECDAKFALKSYLTAHIRTHSGDKPFVCSDCDARFTQKSSLTTHERKHSRC